MSDTEIKKIIGIDNIIKEQALLLRLPENRDKNLILVMSAGVISGRPVFCEDKIKKEEAVKDAIVYLERSHCQFNSEEFCTTKDLFLLADVKINHDGHTLDCPYLFVRYDSVLASSTSDIANIKWA